MTPPGVHTQCVLPMSWDGSPGMNRSRGIGEPLGRTLSLRDEGITQPDLSL